MNIITNLSQQPVRSYSKDQQTAANRLKLSRQQRSELCAKETNRLKERSGGACEKCDRARATEKAHIERRWKSEGKPTAEDFAHLCTACHRWCDSCKEGRAWLTKFGRKLKHHE
ncbi:hypothetical protein D3C81_1855110 [compost metagenome]